MNFIEKQIVKNDGAEYKVIFSVLLFIIMLDVCIRLSERSLSGNINHIYDIPEIVKNYSDGQLNNVALIGNSLTNDGVDAKIFSDFVKKKNPKLKEITVKKITPDATSLWEWYFILKNFLLQEEVRVDLIISGFAWDQLSDQNIPNPSRLAGYFCSVFDLPELIEFGMDGTDDILEFMAAKISKLYVNREAIRKRLLDIFIVHYRDVTQQLNKIGENNKDNNISKVKSQPTYQKLEQYFTLLNKNSVSQIFIAMPVIKPYQVDSRLMDIHIKNNVMFFDLRQLPDINEQHFADPIHLNDTGRYIFSRKLADLTAREYPFSY